MELLWSGEDSGGSSGRVRYSRELQCDPLNIVMECQRQRETCWTDKTEQFRQKKAAAFLVLVLGALLYGAELVLLTLLGLDLPG